MLNAFGLPLFFWAEAVSTTCYTQNRSLVVKRFEKTPYQLLYKKKAKHKVLSCFGCKCYVLNDREHVGKFDPKGDDAIFIGYAWDFVAYRVYIPRTQIDVVIQDKYFRLFNDWYEDFEENDRTSASSDRASVNDDRASTRNTIPTEPSNTCISTNPTFVLSVIPSETSNVEQTEVIHEDLTQSQSMQEITSNINLPHAIKWTNDHPQTQIIGDLTEGVNTRANVNYCMFACFVSKIEPKKVTEALADPFWVKAMQDVKGLCARQ
ncbi:hypothetical protein OSB04_003077 [Centaurea solstitialis]|uniref:Retroviral polymerase SH3-like domain-containing protein n=1 Tax=Centaurea solstitialis TaxID=347529 RepID=A0AA38WVK0_9ASTR|nr:hypothetical protein OSB04_003077 [Centaurea solstitialis]